MNNNLQMIHEQEEAYAQFDNALVNQLQNEIDHVNKAGASQKFSSRVPAIEYENDEDELICGRFPHLDVCACDISCAIALKEINLFEVYPGIFMGPYQSAFKTQDLIEKGITHILNVSCKEYTKRQKYFKYLDVPIQDEVGEDAQEYFRITNRFIEQGIKHGAILIHSVQGKSRAPTIILAYLIWKEKMKLRDGLGLLREYVNEVEPNESFMQQLATYDLDQISKNEYGK